MTSAFQTDFYAYDWAATPVGAVSSWDEQLEKTVEFMLEAHHPMFAIWGTEKTFLFNEAYAPILGEAPFTALGQPLDKLWSEVWDSVEPYAEAALAGQSAIAEDLPFKTWASDFSETRYYTFSYTPVRDSGGNVAGASCLCIDTTEKVEAVARIKSERDSLYRLFQEAPGFIAMGKGPEHRFTFANAAYVRLVGREVVGRTVAEVMPEIVSQGFTDLLDVVYATGERFVAEKMPIEFEDCPNGPKEERFVNFVYEAMRNSRGGIEGIFVEGYDVTEEVKAEQKIKTLQTELIYVSRVSAMSTMAATLAHELNQPLTAITNYASGVVTALGRPGLQQSTILEGVEEISRSANRAGDIIRSLRNMTRRGETTRTVFNLETVGQEAIQLVRAGGRNWVAIECDFAADIEAFGDPVQIQQVLINLIRNACEAVDGRDRGEVKVTIAHSNDGAIVCVEDNGPGIGPHILDANFGSFVSTKPDGMGIGLSISRTIIEAHGGQISARNKQEGGAAFSFVLPKVDHAMA
jgi:two-component system, LuxR family, sensor kinase FixL